MKQWYFRSGPGKTEYGPVSVQTIKQLAQNERLARQHELRKEGTEKWVRAASIQGLRFGQVRATTQSPSPVKQNKAVDPDAKHASETWLIVLALTMIVIAAGVTAVFFFSAILRTDFARISSSEERVEQSPTDGTLDQITHHPKPVKDALLNELVVFELTEWDKEDWGRHQTEITLYLILDNKNHVEVIRKYIYPAGSVYIKPGAFPNGITSWGYNPNKNSRVLPTGSGSDEVTFFWSARESLDGYEIVCRTVIEDKIGKYEEIKTIEIVGQEWQSSAYSKNWMKEEIPGLPNPQVRPVEKATGSARRLDSIARKVPIGDEPEIDSAPVNPEVAADNVTRPDSDVKGNQDNEKIAEDVQPKKPEISVGAGGELESSKRFPLDNDIPTELRELVGKQQEKLLNGLWDMVEASQQELTTTKNVFGESKVVKRLKTKIATLENSIRTELQSGDTWLFKVTGFKVNFGTPIVFTEFGVNSVRIGSGRYRLESLYKCELIPEENLQTEGIEDWIPGDWILATVKPDGRTNIIPQVRINRKYGSSLKRTGIVCDLLDFRRIGQTKSDFQKFLLETKDAQTQQPAKSKPTVNSTIRSTRKVALKAGFYEGTNGDGKIELIIKGDLIIQVSEKDPTLFTKIWKKELRHPLNEESRQMFSQSPNRENLLVVQQLDRFVISADVIPTNGDLSDIQDSFTVTRKNNNMKIRRPDRSASRGLKSNWKAIIQRSAPQLLQGIK